MVDRKRNDADNDGVNANRNDGLDLQDEDRLPWLEPVEDYDREPTVSPTNLLGLVLGGLLLLGVIVGGIYWLQNRSGGSGDLIAAQDGDYKVPPNESGAKTFDGTGDASFATSEGAEPNGKIDASKVAEEPAVAKVDAAAPTPAAGTPGAKIAEAQKAAAAKASASAKSATPTAPVKASAASAAPKMATAPAVASTAAGTVMVQLGAFGSEATANGAWGGLTKRFSFLAGLSKTVVPAAVGGGTVYRLRANAGTMAQANDICTKLRAAGENCIVVK